jgi:predicted RNA-binding protein
MKMAMLRLQMTNRIVIVIVCCLMISCNTSKIPFYKYTTNIYSIDTVYAKNLVTSSCFISCGKWLFEFKIKIKNYQEVVGYELVKDSTKYDTVGVYVLSAQTKQYYEFDTFALTSNLVKKGSFESKESGNRISFAPNSDSTKFNYGPLKDTVINHIQSYTSILAPSNNVVNDSFFQQIFLLKQPGLNTLYKFMGIEYTDKRYCVIGFNQGLTFIKQAVVDEIIDLRILTERERAICTSMLKKAGLQ